MKFIYSIICLCIFHGLVFSEKLTSILTFDLHQDAVNSSSFSPDGNLVVSSSNDNTAKVWNSKTGELIFTLKGNLDYVGAAVFSTDGSMIICGSDDGTVTYWDALNGKILSKYRNNFGLINNISINPNEKTFVVAGNGVFITILDYEKKKVINNYRGHNFGITDAVFSKDGKKLLTCSYDKTAKIWDHNTGELIKLHKRDEIMYSCDFSPDGSIFVVGSKDGNAYLIHTETGMELKKLRFQHEKKVSSVAFSPNGNEILTASEDNTALIWDLKKGKVLYRLTEHTDKINSAKYSPDGKYIITSSSDKKVKIWLNPLFSK